MMSQRLSRLRLTPEAWIIASFACANVIFHLLLPEYGYHRDEMYYVAIADGFSFSNLDMPPGSPLYLKIFLILFGHSLKVVHLAASVCGSLVIVFGGLIAKESAHFHSEGMSSAAFRHGLTPIVCVGEPAAQEGFATDAARRTLEQSEW